MGRRRLLIRKDDFLEFLQGKLRIVDPDMSKIREIKHVRDEIFLGGFELGIDSEEFPDDLQIGQEIPQVNCTFYKDKRE